MTYPLFITFCALATVTVALALRRLIIVRLKGDECLHLLDSDAPVIERQETSARLLDKVDAWGKTLTVLTILSGIAAYSAWWFGK
jgi:hypothetical protein